MRLAHRIALLALLQLVFLSACGGGSSDLSSSSGANGGGGQDNAPNVVAVTVDQGPSGLQGIASFNVPFISVRICAPGSTTNCQTIDHVEVDTGSYGLRIISSVMSATLLAALQPATVSNMPIVECTVFADGFSWGSVRNADVHVSGETASNIPIQIIGDPAFPNVPSTCQSPGRSSENTVNTFGANGILGVGPFVQDCVDCTTSTESLTYYACSSNGASCNPTMVAANQIVSNPVSRFTTDNNGIILKMSSVADTGALPGTGVLIFGIDTQSNNMLGSATVLRTNALGFITINYNQTAYSDGFIDSGTNLLLFNDNTIATCVVDTVQFFCPAGELTPSAINIGADNAQSTVSFKVANASTLLTNTSFTAFDNIAAPATSDPQGFDFGLPFFYGRNVFIAIEGKNSSGGMGPYFAY